MKMPSVAMKKIVGRNILPSYPNFSKMFIIHTDDRKMQPRRLIIRKWEFHYHLLTQINPRLINYTKTLIFFFNIVEALKDSSVPLY